MPSPNPEGENQGGGDTVTLTVPPELAGARLDKALATLLPDRSRAFVQKLLERQLVLVDSVAAKPALRLRGGETLRVEIPAPTALDLAPQNIPLDVLYEDSDIVVINKRPGMVAHPSQGHSDGTLVNALLHHYGDSLSGIGGVIRPGIVHRLDQDTSGCLVAAKHDEAHRSLIQQFMEREVEKIYLAITDGLPKPLSGKVEGQIGRSHKDRKRHAMLRSGGRHSLTVYQTLENYGVVALVRCDLKTGRTHQARVHLAHLNAPVLCDKEYGRRHFFTRQDVDIAVSLYRYGEVRPQYAANSRSNPILLDRQALHAWRLGFAHPVTGAPLSFEAPLPDDMLAVLEPLRQARAEAKRG
ncbi:MAG: RluA family pseudouridine synthase [Planctomycetes bacterium]|nr:RluA family pseudouridine synthase [Planctomycetota bacterium]